MDVFNSLAKDLPLWATKNDIYDLTVHLTVDNIWFDRQ